MRSLCYAAYDVLVLRTRTLYLCVKKGTAYKVIVIRCRCCSTVPVPAVRVVVLLQLVHQLRNNQLGWFNL